MITYGQKLTLRIDAAFATDVATKDDGPRKHLGASVVGKPCMRALWYSFRWADKEDFSGRVLRLFERGQLEEARFVRLLQLVGATVYTHDAQGNQFKVTAHGGHFGGSCDGVATNLREINAPVLVEFKTHGVKSFAKLSDGVQTAKPEHYRQMMVYCHLLDLKKALYMAVCKDSDELHIELLDYDPAVARQMMDRAETIIFGQGIPPKISDTSAFFECRYCSMRGVCWEGKEVRMNCRTCVHSKPEKTGGWSCAKGRAEIVETPKTGCQEWAVMPELA